MNYKYVLALDPSGAFKEGKGTTGWCVFHTPENKITLVGDIRAISYEHAEAYWNMHLDLIDTFYKKYKAQMVVVLEDYFLYADKAADQINSRMETCKLIGIIQHHCYRHHIPYVMQTASEVKTRWPDDILYYKRYIIKQGRGYAIPATKASIDRHCKDAIRHAVHYATFKNN